MTDGPPSGPSGPGSGDDSPDTGSPEEWQPSTDPVVPVPVGFINEVAGETQRLAAAIQTTAPKIPPDWDPVTLELYAEIYGQLVASAGLIMHNFSAADDVVQDAFIDFQQQWMSRVGEERDMRAALWRLVRQRAASAMERSSYRQGMPRPRLEDVPSAEQDPLGEREPSAVLAALSKLPPRQREAIGLEFFMRLSSSEIADAMGIRTATVRALRHQALSRLRDILESEK
jgi:RNA polymerase sigma factor (sigma-70 family)